MKSTSTLLNIVWKCKHDGGNMSERDVSLHHVHYGKWSAEDRIICPHCRKGITVEYMKLDGDSDLLIQRFTKEKTGKSRKEKP